MKSINEKGDIRTRLLRYTLEEKCIVVNIRGFNSKIVIGDIFAIVKYAIAHAITKIVLDFSHYSKRTYPNIILPISGMISYFSVYEGITFEYINLDFDFVKDTGFPKSYRVNEHKRILELDVFNKIIEFNNSEEINAIIDCVFTQLTKMFTFPPGVLKGANWGISEIMDNVINHAASSKAYIMLQIHQKINSLICIVYDNGQGIYNSLRQSVDYSNVVKDDLAAIKLATEKGITRNSRIGAGYGLWGLSRIVKENKGSLAITSGNYNLLLDNLGDYTSSVQRLKISDSLRCTMVELVIKYDEYIDMRKVFSDYSENYETYDFVTKRIESMEDDLSCYVVFKLDQKSNLRTRTDGEEIRNEIINAHIVSGKPIKIDFSNVNDKVTSSFIDETIAKLYTMNTIDDFQKKYKILGADDFTKVLIRKTIEDRFNKSYANILTLD